MTDILDSGSFKIISLAHENSPIGVDLTKLPTQIVRVNGPAQNWEFHKVAPHRYRLSIGGYRFTGVRDDKVIASINPEHEAEWEVTHQEHRNAYTIALASEHHLGWTVPINLAEGHQVELKPIRETRSIPPQFSPIQLFLITRHE